MDCMRNHDLMTELCLEQFFAFYIEIATFNVQLCKVTWLCLEYTNAVLFLR